jgi:ATPase family associated with various cellular activities (AAA)
MKPTIHFTREFRGLPDMLVHQRLAAAIDERTSTFRVMRQVRFAARESLDLLLDSMALELGWNAHRLDTHSLLMEMDEHICIVYGSKKTDYCSCMFTVWAADPARAEATMAAVLAHIDPVRIREPMFSIDWHFLTGDGYLQDASIEELANDSLLDAAYPTIEAGVSSFIEAYLDASESILVLQGPPGTGKTRLIRAILGEMSRRRGQSVSALYTGDRKALESDEIYVKFITGDHEAFVVEDADHALRPRSDGNENLHRFLAISDGVVRGQGRKIIFSTNLPNVGDLDDALIRPGRCYARTYVRELTKEEAYRLTSVMLLTPEERRRANGVIDAQSADRIPLAKVYQAAR